MSNSATPATGDGQKPEDQAQQGAGAGDEFDAEAAFNAFADSRDGGSKASDADATGDSPADDSKDPAPAATKPDDAASAAKPDDLWTGVPEDVRNRLSAHYEQRERTERGRVAALQRRLNEVERGVKPATPAAAAAPEPNEAEVLGKIADNPKLKKLAEDYPDIADAVAEAAREGARAALSITGHKLDRVAKTSEQILADRQAGEEAHLKEQLRLIKTEHNDFEEVVKDPGFYAWVDDQPREVREIFQANAKDIVDAKAAGQLLAGYKASRTGSSQPRDASPAPSGANDRGDPSAARQPASPNNIPDRRRSQLQGSLGARSRVVPVADGLPEDPDKLFNYFADNFGRGRSGART